jgi:hypothetical protein
MTNLNIPQPPTPKIPSGASRIQQLQSRANEARAAIEKSKARRSAGNIAPAAPTTINQDTLVPETPFETPPPDRNGFLNRIQSFAEASAGGIAKTLLQVIPGEQTMFNEKALMKNITDAGDEMERPTNPWDMLRWDAMRTAEGWRRTDQASITLDLIPGDGINLPGDRTLNEIDFGVKGAAELILDPLNLVPFGTVAKLGGKGTAIALRKIGAGAITEAALSGRSAVAAAADSVRGFAHPLGNVPQPKDLLPNQSGPVPLREMGPGRYFRGVGSTGRGAVRSGLVEESDLVAGPGKYITEFPSVAEDFTGTGGKVTEYRLDLRESSSGLLDGVLALDMPVREMSELHSYEYSKLAKLLDDFDLNLDRFDTVGEAYFTIQGQFVDQSMDSFLSSRKGPTFAKRLKSSGLSEDEYIAKRTKEITAEGQKELNDYLKKDGFKVIDNSGSDELGELIVLDESIMKEVASRSNPKGLRQPDSRFVRPDSTDQIVKSFDEALEKMPNWVASIRDMEGGTLSKYAVGPLQWGMTRMNPMTMLHAGSTISRKLRLATIAHQIQAVAAPTQTEFALRTLNNFAGYKGDLAHGLFSVKNEGVLARLGINKPIVGVFDVDDFGIIENLVKVDGSIVQRAGDGLESQLHQYNVFEAAFKGNKGYSQANTFLHEGTRKLITELPEAEIDRLIATGKVSPVFVNQSFAISHIQDWFKEAGGMLDEFGVPRTDVYEGDDIMQYIARTVIGRDDIPFPKNKKTTGAVQDIAKKRVYTEETFREGLDSGLQYQPNFMLSARDFSDSVYMSIRDTQLKNKADSLGHRIRDEELGPIRNRLNSAKEHLGRINHALTLVNDNTAGKRLKGSQVGALRRVGDELGFDWSETKAIDVTDRQVKALNHARVQSQKMVTEAKAMKKYVVGKTSKDMSALFTQFGIPHSRSGNIWNASEIPMAFQQAYPEFTKELRKLQAIDVRIANGVDLVPNKVRRTGTEIITTESKRTRAWTKARKKLKGAIDLDAERHAADAGRADATVKAAQGRAGSLTGSDQKWLGSHFPALRKLVDQANLEDVGTVRKERLAVVRGKLEVELAESKKLTDFHADDLSKTAKGLRGDLWTVESKGFDHVTGKHPISVVSGGAYRDALEKGTLLVKRKEASQQRLGFMSGLFFTEDDVKLLERALLLPDTSTAKGQAGAVFLRVAPAAGDLVRVLKAGFDFGAPFLQGIPVLARRPDIWAKSTVRHMKVFAQGSQIHTTYLQQNMGALREMVQMGVPFGGAASDYFVAVQRGGILPKAGQTLDDLVGLSGSSRLAARAAMKSGRSFEAVATRFEQSFEAFGDYARIEMWKAMRDTAAKDGETGLKELAAFIRNSTGALNSGSLGVSPTQQALERGWLFFSPRYTRASLALVADAFQGGLRGREARQTFANMVAGGTAAYAGFVTAYNKATGNNQAIKLDPRSKADGGDGAEFMTIEMNGNNVGIGSFWTSFTRLIASTGSEAIEDPRTLMKPSTRDNPIVRWLRSRSAPMTGMAVDLQNGATFMGEPLDNTGDWTKHLAKQTMPFVLENAIFDDGAIFGRLTTAMPAEMLGGRTFPVSVIEQRNTERDLAAAERFDKQWDELNGLQKDSLENDPNRSLGRLSQMVKDESSKMRPADPESADGLIDAYFADKEEIEIDWRSTIKQGVDLYNNMKIDAVTLKGRYIEPANADRRLRIGDLSNDDSFQEVEDYFAQLSADGGAIIPEEYAFSKYIDEIVSADFTDPIIGFNFRARDAAERKYGDEFGQEMLAYVRERFKAARESYDFQMPSMLDELYIGRERFQWYWRDVEAEVMKQQRNPEQVLHKYEQWLGSTPTTRTRLAETNRDLKSFLSTMSKTRRLLREKNSELDAFMYRWGFADTLAHKDNQFEDALDFWRHAPGMTFPLPIPKFE